MAKRIYRFGSGTADGDRSKVALLGGKGANLAEMSRIGIPVPPGFTLTTDVCTDFYQSNQSLPLGLGNEIEEAVEFLEETVGRTFGDESDPLLVSVRSGAPFSMPGMMDTILNLGLTRKGVHGLAKKTGDERFAWDTYRRLIQMFGDVVFHVPAKHFHDALEHEKKMQNAAYDAELQASSLETVVDEYLKLFEKHDGKPFPDDPKQQLRLAIESVFRSWKNPRAVTYRRINDLPEDIGTAVTVQSMVFGNRGDDCGTGVAFSRSPSSGRNVLVGEYLLNAQGEDVVAGIRTPKPLNEASRSEGSELETLEKRMPAVYAEFAETCSKLEKHYGDMQDIEFTIESRRLWILQTRSGKRTTAAALKIAVDLVDEGVIDRKTALLRIPSNHLDHLLHPAFDPEAERDVLAKGLPASPGAVTGKVVFDPDEAETMAEQGEKVILVRTETSPEDIHGMHVSEGILTSRGGMTSHAAVVARGMGKCCIVGCGDVSVAADASKCETAAGVTIEKGHIISLDGATGEVLRGELRTIEPKLDEDFERFMAWADEFRSLNVRTNADTPQDCRTARNFGAEGVGLCRTEHMFFDKKRIDIVRQMIIADSEEVRRKHLDMIYPMQLDDFREIFREMRGLPVTIRLLDPPLHEFLPANDHEILDLASRIELSPSQLAGQIKRLHENNPMLGHRGCRLAITYPEIYEMQVRAIMTAACEVDAESDEKVYPEIMVPLISEPKELDVLFEQISNVAESVKNSFHSHLRYYIGTMIELPRAALTAGEIAKKAEFFSFGTNDLTQTTFGLSRDDSGMFLPKYLKQGILPRDPFASLDADGVGELVKIGVERGRAANPQLKIGICGEHGGDPASIKHFHHWGFSYVSCSPYRVPVARLAAAQVALTTSDAST